MGLVEPGDPVRVTFSGAPTYNSDMTKLRAKPTHLKLTLVENGIDFVRSGIERYFLRDAPSPRDHKYAVLHVFAGVLLLLKARLSREHPSLIFTKVEDVGNPEAVTVGLKAAIDRLKTTANIDLTSDRPTLIHAQRTRNRLEHYDASLDLKETQELVGRLCEFVYVFSRDQLAEDLQTHLKGPVWDRVQNLRGIAEALKKKRCQEWKKRVSHFAKFTKAQLEKVWQDAPRPEPDDDISTFAPLECPECIQERVIVVEPDLAICTHPECGEVFLAGSCLRCDRTILGEDEGFCSECLDYMNKD